MSTALFSLLIFFSVTGITLNHLDWVSQSNEPELWQSRMPATVLESFSPPITHGVLNWLTVNHSLTSASNIEWDNDTKEVMIDYPYPAGFAYVILNTESGEYSIDHQTGSIWQIMNDLHKGRHSGQTWSWLIDVSAAFMVFFSITGLIILWQNRPKRKAGIAFTLFGTATPIVLFLLYVPKLSGV